MSTSSTQSRGLNRRINSLQSEDRLSRHGSHSHQRKNSIDYNQAYTHALRVAYLVYLLQPRQKKTQHVPAPQQIARAGTGVDWMKEIKTISTSNSGRFPKGFMTELGKRLEEVFKGTEKLPEYKDPLIRRTFSAFLIQFQDKHYRKTLDTDRTVEPLALMFISRATGELRKGKAPDDDSWKMMSERHLAMFIRLLRAVLKDKNHHDWARDRPELTARLETLERKILQMDEDLTSASTLTSGAGTTIEVEVPLSHEVKDMPLVQRVARIFGLTNTMAQSDINKNRPVWTIKAAVSDLKTYQANLSLNTRHTLRNEDFDTDNAFELWRDAEKSEVAAMITALVKQDPGAISAIAKAPRPSSGGVSHSPADSGYSETIRRVSEPTDHDSYAFDQPVDVSGLNLSDDGSDKSETGDSPYVFIPPDPRSYFKFVLMQILSYDFSQGQQPGSDIIPNSSNLLSNQSLELLGEIAMRWRIPHFSRSVLFLDAAKDKFMDQDIDINQLDMAFQSVKEYAQDSKHFSKSAISSGELFYDKENWTIADFVLYRAVLSAIYEALLRDLYNIMLQCYEQKPPTIGNVMLFLQEHLHSDPQFSPSADEEKRFQDALANGLKEKAREVYSELVKDKVPEEQNWEFYHIIQLGQAVMKLAERLQKRYRKSPEIMGVNPMMIYIKTVLPAFANDARDMIVEILADAKDNDPVPMEDGFDLYKELKDIRRIFADALPGVPFTIPIEELLNDFVWRLIADVDKKLLTSAENAIKRDDFRVRTSHPEGASDDERHSTSIMDMYQFFNQSIQQLIGLEWDDDLQYAKFMTALSRSVGGALSRYCEIVFEMFKKEMSRISPAQEAALTQSKQEKWMQAAKDAWSNKEKIEPFQFYPQSLVKLNNIEWATYQLDDIQRRVDVDTLATIVKKRAPPLTHRQKRTNNYFFTIKIVEAENLKACDVSGYSDPYVVLGDEYQKRLAKTRIIYSNLNPCWDETVEITTAGPINIIATIWDWDTLGPHDYVGRTNFKLDPSAFSDYLPQDIWADLDTQGRLLLRVSMEGERDDIEFYYGKAFRTLKRTEREMTRSITDKLSAYIRLCLSRTTLRGLLSKGISMSSVSSLFSRNRTSAPPPGPSDVEIYRALDPLTDYFNDNFYIMRETLTSSAMIMVMTRLWKEVLTTLESLLVPPLSDKPSSQRQLSQQEVDIVFKWLQHLLEFFQAIDEETGESLGVPVEILKSTKYIDLVSINFFYNQSTEDLIRTSERTASAAASRNRISAPPSMTPNNQHAWAGSSMLLSVPSARRAKSIMRSRTLGTMRQAKAEKRKEAQAEPSDDMILRILRMRPEAERYLKDRARQKEKLAAQAAADAIVRQSVNASNRMMSRDHQVGGGERMR